MSTEGFIYVFKCIVGPNNDICKIGKTRHFKDERDRMNQHSRTLYYGFVPYTDFTTGKPIATGFKIKNYDKADDIIKYLFHDRQLSSIEIYNIDYDVIVEQLWKYLTDNNLLIAFIKDGVSAYEFLSTQENIEIGVNTTKDFFEDLKNKLLFKYNGELPDELIILLKNKEEFIKTCSSHYKSGNYIDFPNNYVLDIHYNKAKRVEILSKLSDLL